jgi:hypothetical protein
MPMCYLKDIIHLKKRRSKIRILIDQCNHYPCDLLTRRNYCNILSWNFKLENNSKPLPSSKAQTQVVKHKGKTRYRYKTPPQPSGYVRYQVASDNRREVTVITHPAGKWLVLIRLRDCISDLIPRQCIGCLKILLGPLTVGLIKQGRDFFF